MVEVPRERKRAGGQTRRSVELDPGVSIMASSSAPRRDPRFGGFRASKAEVLPADQLNTHSIPFRRVRGLETIACNRGSSQRLARARPAIEAVQVFGRHDQCRPSPWLGAACRTILSVWRLGRRLSVPSGLAERIDRVRGNEPFEHWVRHQIEAAVLDAERAQGLVSASQADQISAQDTELEQQREPGERPSE